MKTAAFTKTYNGALAVSLPELELQCGKLYAVIGANGSGKSTAARVLAGVEKPDRGDKPARGIKTGYMPQKSFPFRMSVRKNLRLAGGSEEKTGELSEALGLSRLEGRNAKKLSGGETARMALARLLSADFQLLILDEPSASMDIESTLKTEEAIRKYAAEAGAAVLLVTHSLQQAVRLADNIIFLHKGRLLEQGSASQLISDPQTEELRQFLNFYR